MREKELEEKKKSIKEGKRIEGKEKRGESQERKENQGREKKKGVVINERKGETIMSFFAKESEICEAVDAKEMILLLMYIGVYLSSKRDCFFLVASISRYYQGI